MLPSPQPPQLVSVLACSVLSFKGTECHEAKLMLTGRQMSPNSTHVAKRGEHSHTCAAYYMCSLAVRRRQKFMSTSSPHAHPVMKMLGLHFVAARVDTQLLCSCVPDLSKVAHDLAIFSKTKKAHECSSICAESAAR